MDNKNNSYFMWYMWLLGIISCLTMMVSYAHIQLNKQRYVFEVLHQNGFSELERVGEWKDEEGCECLKFVGKYDNAQVDGKICLTKSNNIRFSFFEK